MRYSLPLIFLIAACSSEPVPGASDTGRTGDDARQPTDTHSSSGDDVTGTSDLGADTSPNPDLGGPEDGGSEDVGELSDDGSIDMATGDTAVDMDPPDDPFAGRPLGQCTENADCPDGPQGRMCSRALPGGACLGCADDGDCPSGTTCSMFGACITDCSSDDDCPPGLRCLGSGRCAALDCDNGACPVGLFGCSDGDSCERIDCAQDPNVCPDGTTCVDELCIEDRALNP